MYKRILNLTLPPQQSTFLWGARQTGKSSFLREHYPNSTYYDLLDTHEMARFTKEPNLLYQEIKGLSSQQRSLPIIIDEVQKVPDLLNEVHRLIENEKVQFILCGSSARKLKNQSTNLLGGRAWLTHLYPLTSQEIGEVDLLRALQHGLLPKHYNSDPAFIQNHLQAYIDSYLTEEIRNEGLVRNLKAFARFLDVAALTNAEMVNANNIARDCGIDRSTVQGYYQILIDTLLGFYIYPYNKKVKRDLITATPKFYLFDVGITNYIAKQSVSSLKGSWAGKQFEHYILMELVAYIGYHRLRSAITYWRTKTGLEVDFVLGDADIAIEVKISTTVHQEDLKGLLSFCEEHPNTRAIVVSQDKHARVLDIQGKYSVNILPWRQFLQELWQGNILTNY